MFAKRRFIAAWATMLVVLATMACSLSINVTPTPPSPTATATPAPTAVMVQTIGSPELKIVMQRLYVTYHGQDGSTLIGTGCPGNDSKGTIIDIHFSVTGVDPSRRVTRILVAGNNSTLTWEKPCNGDWGLEAIQGENGQWEIYIAPSEAAEIYTLLFFYEDNSMAMGMVKAE